MARLGDIFLLIRNGASIKQTDGAGGYPITRIETIATREIDRTKLGYAGIEDIEKYHDYILRDGDILMSHINSEKHLGKVALYHAEGNEKIIHGMNLLMLRADTHLIQADYAFYFFNSEAFLRQIPNITKKSVNQASFTVAALKELAIPIPTLSKQEKISQILGKISSVISLRKQQLAKLDELVKARFVEMFGDPKENPKGYSKRHLKETCKVITGNTPSRAVSEYYGEHIEWIKTDNIVSGLINPTTATEFLSEKGMAVGRTVEKDSILMACIAGSLSSIGRVCVTARKVAFNQQINAIVPNKYNILFLYVLLQISKEYLVEEISMALKGILSKSKLEEKVFIVPPMELQEEFAAFVEQVDKSKLTIQQSLDKLETLKKALMQEYFG